MESGVASEGKKLLNIMVVVIYLLVIAHGAAMWLYLYWTLPWFDLVTHFVGGVWVAFASLWLVFYSGYLKPENTPARTKKNMLLTALISVAIVGIIWEVYEFVGQYWLNVTFASNYSWDTFVDVVMDMVGALAAYWIFSRFIYKESVKSIIPGSDPESI